MDVLSDDADEDDEESVDVDEEDEADNDTEAGAVEREKFGPVPNTTTRWGTEDERAILGEEKDEDEDADDDGDDEDNEEDDSEDEDKDDDDEEEEGVLRDADNEWKDEIFSPTMARMRPKSQEGKMHSIHTHLSE